MEDVPDDGVHPRPAHSEADRDAARIAAELQAKGGGADPFAAAVRATRMPMLITDPRQPDNPVVFANAAFCRMTGYDRDEIVGRNCRFLQGGQTDPADVARIRDAVRSAQPIEIDIRNHRKTGEPFWNRLLLAPVRAADGSLAYFFASQMDVSLERERLERLESDNAALAGEVAGRLREQQESEARFRFAAETGRLGIWDLDLRTRELTASAIFKEVYGRGPAEPFGYDAMLAAVHPDDASRLRQAMEQAIGTGRDCDAEYRILRPDGSVGWVQLRAQVMRAVDGAPTRMAGLCLDVTGRRIGDLRLELSEQSLRMATEAAEVGIWDLDLVTDTLTWSDRTKAAFGISPGAPCSMRDFYAGLHPADLAGTTAAFGAALDPAVRATYDVEYRTIGKEDGVVRWVAAKGRGLFDADGVCHRALGTAIDVTARKVAETRQAARADLTDALRRAADSDSLLAVAAERLGRQLSAACVGYSEADRAGQRLYVRQHWAAVGAACPSGWHPIDWLGPQVGAAMRAGRTVVVRDTELDPRTRDAKAGREQSGARALIKAPLVQEGRPEGVLFVFSAVPRAWTDDEVSLVEEVAERTGAALRQLRAEAALRQSEARFQAIVDSVDQIIWSALPDGRHDYHNRRWYEFTGLDEGSGDDQAPSGLVHPDDKDEARSRWLYSLATGAPYRVEYRLRRHDGRHVWVLARAEAVRDSAGRVVRWFGTCTDIQQIVEAREVMARSREELERLVAERTGELMQAEAALRQAQKMEAVGHLTGGLAHDFNNLLAAIMGSLELIETRVAAGRLTGLDRYTGAAMTAAKRAAALTQRLLAFARRQPLDPKRVDANRLLAGMDDLLRRTLGPAIELRMELEPGLQATLCDPNQLESAILNLAINARDAMPGGGLLTIETADAVLDEAYVRAEGGQVQPGRYVAICVADTGAGMAPEIMARVFDPFFTTKPIGQGTGLGLSMLYGFVKQSEGHVRVYSEVGRGTTFKLYLPRDPGKADDLPAPGDGDGRLGRAEGGETVLVVDDMPTVRMLVVETLRELGYAAIEAEDGPSGLRIVQSGVRIDLLVTDVGLPGLNGRQLADAARAIRPGLRVLFVTGYAHNAAVGSGEALGSGMEMLSKPFALRVLARKVQEMLAGG